MKQKTLLKTTLLALALALCGASTAWADEVEVSTQAEFKTAYDAAQSSNETGNVTIKLATGDYTGTDNWKQLPFPIAKHITIQPKDGATVNFTELAMDNGGNTGAGSITFRDLTITSRNDDFIRMRSCGNAGKIELLNCNITLLKSLIGYDSGDSYTLDEINISNCKIKTTTSSGTNFMYASKHLVKKVSITNSVFYNFQGNHFFQQGVGDSEQVFEFVFKNNTIYNWGTAAHDPITRFYFVEANVDLNSTTTYTFKDNVIAGYYGYSGTGLNEYYLVMAKHGTVYVSKNILLGTDTSNTSYWFWNRGSLSTSLGMNWPFTKEDGGSNQTNPLTTTFGFASDTAVPFTDAANGDFTINLKSYPAFATASTVGSPLGAPSTWKYTWNSGTAKAGTLILPYEANIPDGITAFTLTYTSGSSATATEINTGILPANTPVLLNAETASKDYCFTSTGTVPNAAPSDLQKGAMTGVYSTGYVPANSYVLQNGADGLGFYKVTEDNNISIGAYRAYLTAGQNASARFIDINFDDSKTTAINEAKGQELIANGQYFDLQGRKVANGQKPTAKGLYIVNGKKVVIK